MGDMDDYALALQLQAQFDAETKQQEQILIPQVVSPSEFHNFSTSRRVISSDQDLNKSIPLVDERWETLDPNPDVRALFMQFNERFFWKKLDGVEVRWSPRMTMCAGLCCYEGHGGLCSVRLSQPLLNLRPRKDLIETLLHEMIHAYLFVTANNKDHDAHGPEFCKHMDRINTQAATKITVYHSFHDEVDHYRKHWWRCDGPCRSRQPYFGYVKRAMNRPPHPRDTWWAEHQRTCGGSYTKVKEPENYGKKKEKKEKEKKTEKPNGTADIRSFWGGSKVGESSSSQDGGTGASHKPNNNPAKMGTTSNGITGRGRDKKLDNSGTETNGNPATWTVDTNHTLTRPEDSSYSHSERTCSQESFPGDGHTLGSGRSSHSTNQPADRIVRKIPGIGLITCERTSGSCDVKCGQRCNSQSSEELSITRPLHQHLPEVQDVMDLQSDEEFDKMLIPRPKVKGIRQLTPQSASPGEGVRVSGFTSVSNKRRSTPTGAPDRNRKGHKSKNTPVNNIDQPNNKRKTSTKPPKTGLDSDRNFQELKKKKTPPGVFMGAIDRNKRALAMSADSDSDTNQDECMTLGSILNKTSYQPKDNRPVPKRPKLEWDFEDEKPSVSFDNGPQKSKFVTDDDLNKKQFSFFDEPQKAKVLSTSVFLSESVGDYSTARMSSSSSSSLEMMMGRAGGSQNIYTEGAVGGSQSNIFSSSSQGDLADPIQTCPVCQIQVRASRINEHLDLCLAG